MYTKENNKTNPNLILRDDLFCQYCGKQCKNLNALKQHEIRCKANPNGSPHNGALPGSCNIPLESRGWSKGLTKETDERLKHTSIAVKNYIQEHADTWNKREMTQETRNKISKKMMGNKNWENSLGKSGFGKKGYYHGIHCDSTYELAYVIYCLDHGKDIKRSKQVFTYNYKDKLHRYYPDFEVDGELIEIKGYWKQQVDLKLQAVKQANKSIKIYYPEDLTKVFEYIFVKYHLRPGIELTVLYD